jgi:hypothetical protein
MADETTPAERPQAWWAAPWVRRLALKVLAGMMLAAAPNITNVRVRHLVELVGEALDAEESAPLSAPSSSTDGGA